MKIKNKFLAVFIVSGSFIMGMMDESELSNQSLASMQKVLQVHIVERFVPGLGNRPFVNSEQRKILEQILESEYRSLELMTLMVPDDWTNRSMKRQLYLILTIEEIKNRIAKLKMDQGPNILGRGYKIHLNNRLSQLEDELNAQDNRGFIMKTIGRLVYKILLCCPGSSYPILVD